MRYGRTELYRLFSDDRKLLYIGISKSYWKMRRLDHRRVYGKEVSDSPNIEVFETRQEAEIAEAMAQFRERPRDGVYSQTQEELEHRLYLIRCRYLRIKDDIHDLDAQAERAHEFADWLLDADFRARCLPILEKMWNRV